MIKKFLTYLITILTVSAAYAAEPQIDIRYDGIYLDHITLPQLEMLYRDYRYKDYIYMKDWKYPPIFLQSLPTDFEKITSPQERNKLFLQIMIPLTLKVNEEITQERMEIEKIINDYNGKHNLTDQQLKFIEEKAQKYDIFTRLKGERRNALILTQLRDKVDTIPPSILIAAAAIESNWGTNRPARLANSLYRELVWYTEEGLEPIDETEDKNYRYKKFSSLYESVKSFALKINAGINYQQFRSRRAQIKDRDVPVLGRNIAHTMVFASNLKNFSGILDYTITFYELTNIDEASLAPLDLPQTKE